MMAAKQADAQVAFAKVDLVKIVPAHHADQELYRPHVEWARLGGGFVSHRISSNAIPTSTVVPHARPLLGQQST